MKINAYKHIGHPVKLEQTQVQRDWMDQTDGKHAYKCFPVTFANTLGWSISFFEDIEFIWDGISDATDSHVKILKAPHGVCNTQRGNATISFYSGLFFETKENISIISIVPPNYFIDGAIPFTSIISTSFFEDAYPIAWKITRPNTIIKIPAGTPVATLIPLSIGDFSDIELDINDKIFKENHNIVIEKKIEKTKQLSLEGKFTNFYRDAVDPDGNTIGKHEKKSLHLKINDFTEKIG